MSVKIFSDGHNSPAITILHLLQFLAPVPVHAPASVPVIACNLSQYCADNFARAKHFYRDICRGNIFTGTIVWPVI